MGYFEYLKEVVEDIFNSNIDINEKKKQLVIKCEAIESINDEQCKSYVEVIKGYIYDLETIIMIQESLSQLDEYEKKYFENINCEFSYLRLHELLNLRNNIEMFEQFYIDMIQKRINGLEQEKMFKALLYRYKSLKSKIMPDLDFIECTNIYLERIDDINRNRDLSLEEMLKLFKNTKIEIQSLDTPDSKFIHGYIYHIIKQINENMFSIANIGLDEEVKKRH